MTDLAAVVIIAAGALAVGVAVGMLVAPRLTRWADRDDEEPDDD